MCGHISEPDRSVRCCGDALHLAALLVSLLDDRQLGVRVADRQLAVGRLSGPVQHQRPLLDVTALLTVRVELHLEPGQDGVAVKR